MRSASHFARSCSAARAAVVVFGFVSAFFAAPFGGLRVAPASSAMLEGPVLQATESMELRAAVMHGELEKVSSLATRHDDVPALLARAYIAELEGDLEGARQYVSAALEEDSVAKQHRAAQLARARLQRAVGLRDEAEGLLRKALSEHSDAHFIRVELGELLVERGQESQAEPLLEKLSRDFNAGRLDDAAGLYALGDAMALLGSYKDANHAYQLAYEKDSQYLPGVVRWGELFLSKYNTADAEETFSDALDVNEDHPGALVGMARVVMETNNYFEEARRHLARAEKVHASSPGVLLARAELAIYDGDWDEALERVERVLSERPNHLEALSFKAAVYYLKDDREAFERVEERALALRSDFAELYTTTADFAVLVHRYREGIELNRRALELESGHPEALLGLGTGLSRAGKIDEAVEVLERAFNADPYNVRAYNMVQFFDKKLPEYDVFRHDRFLLRAHESEAQIVDRLVSPLVADALEVYREKYDFEPADELSVEVFPDPESFGARTVGLPHISPHGVCFGRVVATRSPSEGNFNWRQVVWHEMAHVFHIQESDYRVPRWFTEGLAEYETNVEDPAWIRHHEPRIAAALREGDIPSVLDLDRRFTQAESYVDILQAYHLSSLVLHFIVEEWSFGKVDEMIDKFNSKVRTKEVIEATFETSVEEFDRRFREWLRKRLIGFDQQLLISLRTVPAVEQLEDSTPESRRDGWYHARLAVAQLREGDSKSATEAMDRALQIGSTDPKVQYAASAFYATRGRTKKAYRHGLKVLDEGRDDYSLRVRLARLARVLEELEAARVHLDAALQLYPDGFEGWKQMLKIAETTDDRSLERRSVRRMFELDQTSTLAARRWTELALEEGRWAEAKEGVERWFAIEPFETELHRTRVEVALQRDRPERALESWEFLALLRPSSADDIWLDAIRAFAEGGYEGDPMERVVRRAREAGVSADAIEGAKVGSN